MTTPTIPAAAPFRRDWLTGVVAGLHLLMVVYVAIGWLSHTRVALLAYLLVLPLIMLQWLFNRGDSIVCGAEALFRSGRWRDAHNHYEDGPFQTLLRRISGADTSQAGIHLVISAAMLLLWIEAFYRMLLIPTNL